MLAEAADDLDNEPEVCDPEYNEGSESGLEEEVVNEPVPVQTSPNEMGPSQKPHISATQEEKKSYASIVSLRHFLIAIFMIFFSLGLLI